MPKGVPGRVFISYATRDAAAQKFVASLKRAMEASGIATVDPTTDVAPGSHWFEEVRNALDSSTAMVAVLSPGALESPGFTAEVGYALMNERFEGRFVPVIVKSIPDASVPAWMSLVPALDARSADAQDEAIRQVVASLRAPRADARRKAS